MDSTPIAQFLESTYPEPALPLTSEVGKQIETESRVFGGTALRISIMPREIRILSPRSQEYFRRTREALVGQPLENFLDAEKEDQAWKDSEEGMRTVGELMSKNKADGPFILGARPSYTDFFIVGAIQCARAIDEGIFQRFTKSPDHMRIYEACQPWMEKKD